MENYSHARTLEQPSLCPFPGLPADTPEVRVKDGSKIRNIMRYAFSRMGPKPKTAYNETKQLKTGEGGGSLGAQEEGVSSAPLLDKLPCRQIVFTGTGRGVSKTITCVEILKRRVTGLYQHTQLIYSTVLEVWEPLEPGAGLDSLTVSRNLPAIWVLLSMDPLDASLPGYQAPGNYEALWAQAAREEGGLAGGLRHGQRRKRGGGTGRGKGGPVQQAGGPVQQAGGPVRQFGRPREPSKGQA